MRSRRHISPGVSPATAREHPVKMVEGEAGAARQRLDGEIRFPLQRPQHRDETAAVVDHGRILAM